VGGSASGRTDPQIACRADDVEAIGPSGISVGHRRAFETMNHAIEHHRIKPVINTVYPIEDALVAFDHLERSPFGKVIIRLARRSAR
jgi:NADPH:quinone reductase-like Zn-dependent oxidoreductase